MGRASPTWDRPSAPVFVLVATLLACAARPEPAPPKQEPPARDLIVRTERFELHANAWVGLHTWLFDRASAKGLESGELGAAAFAADVGAYGEALAATADGESLDRELISGLRRCHDEGCALRTFASTTLEGPFSRALPRYAQSAWTEHALVARAAIERVTPLLKLEVWLTDGLGRDLGLESTPEIVRLDVVAHAGSARAEIGVLGAGGRCFVGDGVLECALYAWARAHEDKLALRRAVLEQPENKRDRARGRREWTAVIAHAISVRVREATGHESRLSAEASRASPDLARWLTREWARRRSGEDVRSFAARLSDSDVWEE